MLILFTAVGIVYEFGTGLGFIIALPFYIFANAIWNRLGGWPEAWYRVTGTDYRQFYIFLPSRKIGRFLKKAAEIVGSAEGARVTIKVTKEIEADYGIPTRSDEMFPNPAGAPASLHNYDDYRPIAVFGREPDALKSDGTLAPKAKISPMLVHNAFLMEWLKNRAKLNVKQSNLRWGIFGFLIAVGVIFDFAILYYTVFYGVNMNCALRTKACP